MGEDISYGISGDPRITLKIQKIRGHKHTIGRLAQMVERLLSMREVQGSMP